MRLDVRRSAFIYDHRDQPRHMYLLTNFHKDPKEGSLKIFLSNRSSNFVAPSAQGRFSDFAKQRIPIIKFQGYMLESSWI